MARYDFLVETYRTERLKILSAWSQVPDVRMEWRPETRGRTPHEHMVHQCASEQAFMQTMLGIGISLPVLPASSIVSRSCSTTPLLRQNGSPPWSKSRKTGSRRRPPSSMCAAHAPGS